MEIERAPTAVHRNPGSGYDQGRAMLANAWIDGWGQRYLQSCDSSESQTLIHAIEVVQGSLRRQDSTGGSIDHTSSRVTFVSDLRIPGWAMLGRPSKGRPAEGMSNECRESLDSTINPPLHVPSPWCSSSIT
jgi:hypothetical protein